METWQALVDKKFTYVVVGVSRDRSKWGYRVWIHLVLKGYTAVPVNPKYQTIEGKKCYQSVTEFFTPGVQTSLIPEVKDTVVVTVVPPVVTKKVVYEAVNMGITKIWMQPGSEIDTANEHMSDQALKMVAGKCIVRDGLGEAFRV